MGVRRRSSMEKILISACLLGEPVRYHGGHAQSRHPVLQVWAQEGRLVPVCPEVLGGLPTPRPAAELRVRRAGDTAATPLVVNEHGADVSAFFWRGAESAAREAAV